MANSTRRGGSGRGSGTVTVIEQRVHRSAAENARFAFILTAIVTGLVALVVAKGYMHPILAAFVAAPVAALCGGLAWTVTRVWPVLRLIWWWTPEITLVVLVAWGWTSLAIHTAAWLTLLVLIALAGLALVPAVRRWTVALAWCLVVRHRLRVCFTQFIIANKSGSLPLILGARPTPVGERVWVVLRPGLSLSYLTQQLDKIAVACHATSVLIDRASGRNSAIVRFDIKRREVLTDTVQSPLIDVIGPVPPSPYPGDLPATFGGLDLPEVDDTPQPAAPAARLKTAAGPNGKRPSATADNEGDDVTQWI